MAEAKRKRALSEEARPETDQLLIGTGGSSLRRKLGKADAEAPSPAAEETAEAALETIIPDEPAEEPEKKEAPAKEKPAKKEKTKPSDKEGKKDEKPSVPDNVTDIRDAMRAHDLKIKKKKKTFVLNKGPKPQEEDAEPKKRHTLAFVLLGLLLIAAGAAIALYFVAQVETITVSGCERFSEADVINLSGLYTGRNLYLYDLNEAKHGIEQSPYLDCKAIRRVFPHELHIEVNEREELLAISSAGGIYTVTDREGFVLDVGKRTDTAGLIPVYGFGSMGFTTGTSIISDRTKLRPYTLMQLIEAIGDRTDRIASIDLSNSASIRITTAEGAVIMLGDSINVPEKIEYMFNALRKADAASLPGAVIYINSNGTADIAYPTPEPTVAPEDTSEPEDTDAPEDTEAPENTEVTEEP